MLNTHLTPAPASRGLHTASQVAASKRAVEVDRQTLDLQSPLATAVDGWCDHGPGPGLETFAKSFKFEVVGQPERKILEALRTGERVALTVCAATAPILIGLDDQLRLTANGPGVHSVIENSSDSYGLDLHFKTDAGNEIFLRESRDGGEKSAILREKQEPGQDWLCLSLEQGPEGTNLSLNSSHGDEGSQLEFRANGQFDASYNQGREVFSVIANSDSVGVITSTGAGRMSQARLGSALQSHQANVALADSRVGGFLANL